MVTLNDIRARRDDILRIAHSHGADDLRIFGSFAAGNPSDDSDLDLVASFRPGTSLIDRIAMMQEIEDILHIKVDVVNERALNDSIRQSVSQQGVAL